MHAPTHAPSRWHLGTLNCSVASGADELVACEPRVRGKDKPMALFFGDQGREKKKKTPFRTSPSNGTFTSLQSWICSRSTGQFSSVAQSGPTLCDPMDRSTPGLPIHHQLLELAQTHVHWLGNAIQSSHSLSSPSPPAFSLSQRQGLFQWVSASNQEAKVLDLQLQHQSFQWIFRTDFL